MKKCILGAIVALFTALSALAQIKPPQLVNFSVRGKVDAGQQVLILGFNVAASPGVSPDLSARFLIRAVGPKLGSFGVPDAIQDPKLVIFDSKGNKLKENDDWGNATDINVLQTQVGAFALDPNGKDAALWVELKPGSYTAVAMIGSGAAGTGLVEVYDAQRNTGLLYLSNLSVRAAGSAVTIGWVADGVGQKRVLVRGVGPGLAQFGVTGFMQDPTLTAFDNKGTSLMSNNDWSGDVSGIAAQVGAFPLQASSKDAAFVLTRAINGPVSTQAQITGASGIGLIEVYDVRQ